MKEIKHRTFIRKNNLEISDFTRPVQKKVHIFKEMYSRLRDTTDEDHSELLKKLASLDREICTDMLDEMEDRLENNEVMEASSDEEILDELWKMKRTKGLSRSDLKKYGLKTNISGWSVQIGKYTLRRTATFSYIYNLER